MLPEQFIKMHGIGNDFVVIDAREAPLQVSPDMVQVLADRRFGVGCDQLAVMRPARKQGDVALDLYNATGDAVEACGNVTRCVATLLFAETGARHASIETPVGCLPAWAHEDGTVSVDMGAVSTDATLVSLSNRGDSTDIPVDILADTMPASVHRAIAIGIGNPHCVVLLDEVLSDVDLRRLGMEIERNPIFPLRTNVEFVSRQQAGTLRMRVWERHVGTTLACGSGACAGVVAACIHGWVGRQADIQLDGGWLHIHWNQNGHAVMRGEAATSFTGTLHPSFWQQLRAR